MKQQQLLLLILLFTEFLLFAQPPNCFSWDNVKINSNNNRNFVSNVQKQPFQNPCISYAFVSAIETKYNIEFNNLIPYTVSSAVPYLDVKVNSEHMVTYKNTLENHNFEIPIKKKPIDENIRFSEFLPNIDNPFHPNYNGYYSLQTNTCIDNKRHFRIKNYASEPDQEWKIDTTCDTESILNNGYLTVSEVSKLDTDSINIVKTNIIENGPLVIKVYGNILSNFKDYTETVNYHAYTIIGWENIDENNTKWRLTDSWTGEDNIIYSKTINNNSFLDFISDNYIEIYSVKGVKFMSNSSSIDRFTVNTSIQCPDPEIAISPIYFDIDYEFIGGVMYHKFWVTSNTDVDSWVWGIDYPNGSIKRSQVNGSQYSSILMSPTYNDVVTVYVNAYKNGIIVAEKERRIYLSNSQSSGGGFEEH